MTFTLDTSGIVWKPDFSPSEDGGEWVCSTDTAWSWSDLSPFAQGYIAAMFEGAFVTPDPLRTDAASALTITRDSAEAWWPESLPRRPVAFSDLSPEALALILADCERAAALHWEPDRDQGLAFWGARTAGWHDGLGDLSAFPPLRVFLNDAGKVQIEPSA